MYKVESNIPIPEHTGAGKKKKYPFTSMEVGQSFFVPCEVSESKKTLSTVKGCALRYKPFIFTAAVEKDGVRIWRIQ